jgi:hypothetical protein
MKDQTPISHIKDKRALATFGIFTVLWLVASIIMFVNLFVTRDRTTFTWVMFWIATVCLMVAQMINFYWIGKNHKESKKK